MNEEPTINIPIRDLLTGIDRKLDDLVEKHDALHTAFEVHKVKGHPNPNAGTRLAVWGVVVAAVVGIGSWVTQGWQAVATLWAAGPKGGT